MPRRIRKPKSQMQRLREKWHREAMSRRTYPGIDPELIAFFRERAPKSEGSMNADTCRDECAFYDRLERRCDQMASAADRTGRWEHLPFIDLVDAAGDFIQL